MASWASCKFMPTKFGIVHDGPEPPDWPTGAVEVAGAVLVTVTVVDDGGPPPQPAKVAAGTVKTAISRAPRFIAFPEWRMAGYWAILLSPFGISRRTRIRTGRTGLDAVDRRC